MTMPTSIAAISITTGISNPGRGCGTGDAHSLKEGGLFATGSLGDLKMDVIIMGVISCVASNPIPSAGFPAGSIPDEILYADGLSIGHQPICDEITLGVISLPPHG